MYLKKKFAKKMFNSYAFNISSTISRDKKKAQWWNEIRKQKWYTLDTNLKTLDFLKERLSFFEVAIKEKSSDEMNSAFHETIFYYFVYFIHKQYSRHKFMDPRSPEKEGFSIHCESSLDKKKKEKKKEKKTTTSDKWNSKLSIHEPPDTPRVTFSFSENVIYSAWSLTTT